MEFQRAWTVPSSPQVAARVKTGRVCVAEVKDARYLHHVDVRPQEGDIGGIRCKPKV